MRIGPQRKFEREETLLDWQDNFGGNGICGWVDWGFPSDGYEFIESQFKRFNVPYPSEIGEIAERCAGNVLMYADCVDPYCLLVDFSDLVFTNQFHESTFEILGDNPELANPSKLETYAYDPGQAEHWFNFFYDRPGLQEIPNAVGLNLREEILDIVRYPDHLFEDLRTIREVCGDKFQSYLELATWASFVWLAGPLGRHFRQETHLLHDVVISHGEGIIYEGDILSPLRYRKHERPYQSCAQCGINSYCNELTEMGGITQFRCEHCMSQGLVLFSGANCGSRICKYVECQHHPAHSMDRTAALYQTLRGGGLLTQKRSQELIA